MFAKRSVEQVDRRTLAARLPECCGRNLVIVEFKTPVRGDHVDTIGFQLFRSGDLDDRHGGVCREHCCKLALHIGSQMDDDNIGCARPFRQGLEKILKRLDSARRSTDPHDDGVGFRANQQFSRLIHGTPRVYRRIYDLRDSLRPSTLQCPAWFHLRELERHLFICPSSSHWRRNVAWPGTFSS